MTTENPPASAPPPAFEVHDAGSANWVVRKIVEARTYAKRIEAWAAAEIGAGCNRVYPSDDSPRTTASKVQHALNK